MLSILRCLFFLTAVVQGGHVTLFRRGDCNIGDNNVASSIVEITAENQVWCADFDNPYKSATTEYDIGSACTFKLYNGPGCVASRLAHTINSNLATGKCLSTGTTYGSIQAICGDSLKTRSHGGSTLPERSQSLEKRGVDNWFAVAGSKILRLRPGLRAEQDYAVPRTIVTDNPGIVREQYMTEANANALALWIVTVLYNRATPGESFSWEYNSAFRMRITFTANRVIDGDRSRQLFVNEIVRGLQTNRMAQLVRDAWQQMATHQNRKVKVFIQWGYGEQDSATLQIEFKSN